MQLQAAPLSRPALSSRLRACARAACQSARASSGGVAVPPAWPGRAPLPLKPKHVPGSGPKPIALIGSTGSIGTQTLDIVGEFPEQYRVVALSAGNNVALLAEQARLSGSCLLLRMFFRCVSLACKLTLSPRSGPQVQALPRLCSRRLQGCRAQGAHRGRAAPA